MIVGITGTQRGATPAQLDAIRIWLINHKVTTLHHGDCIGVDDQVDAIAVGLGIARIIHPPIDRTKRAFCERRWPPQGIWREKPYLQRNRIIVDETDILIALPGELNEVLRSGTWSTIRYARTQLTNLTIIYPGGEIVVERDSVV